MCDFGNCGWDCFDCIEDSPSQAKNNHAILREESGREALDEMTVDLCEDLPF